MFDTKVLYSKGKKKSKKCSFFPLVHSCSHLLWQGQALPGSLAPWIGKYWGSLSGGVAALPKLAGPKGRLPPLHMRRGRCRSGGDMCGSAGPLSWAFPPRSPCLKAILPAVLARLCGQAAALCQLNEKRWGAVVAVIPPCLSPQPGGKGSRADHSPWPKHVSANPSFTPP